MKAKKKPARTVKKTTPAVKKTAVVKAKAVMAAPSGTPFRTLVAIFGGFLITHSAIVYIANMLTPSAVVLGTHMITPFMGLLNSMIVFTAIAVAAIPVIENLAMATNMKLSNMHWMAGFFVVNTLGLWLVARFAEQLGLGLSSWAIAVVLAAIIDVAQGLVYQAVSNSTKS